MDPLTIIIIIINIIYFIFYGNYTIRWIQRFFVFKIGQKINF